MRKFGEDPKLVHAKLWIEIVLVVIWTNLQQNV